MHHLPSRSAFRSFLALTAFLAACSDSPTSPQRQGLISNEQGASCPLVVDEYDPNCPESTVWEPDQVFEFDAAFVDANVTATAEMPTWEGETEPTAVGPLVCPSTIDNGVVFVYQGVRFYAPGPLVYTGPASSGGIYPRGLYVAMAGEIISMDGRVKLNGGVIVECRGRYYKVPRIPAAVWVGRMGAIGGFGTISGTQRGPSGGGNPSGWAWRGIEVTVQTGVGNGRQDALTTYLAGGGCTQGWVIFVDEQQVCKADGTEVTE